ncbi:MAG: acyl-CoA dehydrogenase [Gammaproteobacteria bacterium]|nr:acyl-CoA dehydrogenase [Gammaproteobacteria bacterium]
MALVLNEEQRILRDSARDVLSTHAPVSALRKLRDNKDPDGISRDLWKQLVELGWSGMAVPETYGGSEFGFQGVGIAFEEAGRTLAATPMLSSVVLGAGLVMELGNDAQRETLVAGVVRGETLLALAIDEQPRHQPLNIETTARVDGDGYVLNGAKRFVLDGHIADTLLVVTRTSGANDDPNGLSVFAIPVSAEGLTVTRTWMVDSRNAANIELNNVRCDANALIGPVDGAGGGLERVLDLGRIALAAEMLGSAQEAFDRTLAYLKMREQFGVLIGTFQALKHRMALMFSELELCRSAVYGALSAVDEGATSVALMASLAKSQAGKTFELVAGEALQMHGGIGMTDDEEIGFFLKRARAAQHTLGDAVFHRDRYARLAGY